VKSSLFAWAVAALETGAALDYAHQRNWKLAVLWAGYATAAWVLAGLQ